MSHITLAIFDVLPHRLPALVTVLDTKTQRSDSLLKKRVLFDKVDNIESRFGAMFVAVAKIKPLIIALGIGVIL